MKIYSLKKYANKVGYPHYRKETTLKDIQDYFEEFSSLWDYPLIELDYVLENSINCIIVNTDIGVRLCEV